MSLLKLHKDIHPSTNYEIDTLMQNSHQKRVIAAVIEKDGRFLLAQRGKQDSNYGKWEFPGGKLEKHETDQECLARELNEELAIVATIGRHLCDVPFESKNVLYLMRVYHVPFFQGALILREHLQAHWVTVKDLSSYVVPEPDKPVIAYLQKNF